MAASERLLALLDEMKELHKRKNAGYNGDQPDPFTNFKACQAFDVDPFKGTLVRMSDKWGRICNLAKNPSHEQVGESIKDTLLDLAMYSLIALCLYEEQEQAQQPTEEDGSMVPDIDRCPCGGLAFVYVQPIGHRAQCYRCDMNTVFFDTAEQAITAWNYGYRN